ncbi:MAG: RIP metalloprotease RseP, partial [Candidatus Aminicenantaceae bacterium]
MITVLGSILAFVIVFGILVFIHEFGHFIMAKVNKVRVEVFSWGYGKRLFGIKKGDTDYRISLIPLGGYVKLAGEDAFEGKKDLKPDDFMAKKRWQRFLILVMGSLMNIFLALFILTIINMAGVDTPKYQEQKPVIGWIEPGSPAAQTGLKVGDEILRINKEKTKAWNDVELAVGTKPDRTINVKVKRDEKIKNFEVQTESKTRYFMGYAGFFPRTRTQVQMVSPGSPAEKGGLKAGDVILEINDQDVYFYGFVEIIEKNPGKELNVLAERRGKEKELQIIPQLQEEVGKIGIALVPETEKKKYGF